MSLSTAVRVKGQWHQAGRCGGEEAPGDFTAEWNCRETCVTTIRRKDGRAFKAEQVRVEIVTPLLNYAHVVVPDCGRHYVLSRLAFMIRAPLYRVSGQTYRPGEWSIHKTPLTDVLRAEIEKHFTAKSEKVTFALDTLEAS